METWHEYDQRTGIFTGRSIIAAEDMREQNRSANCDWISGVEDWEAQRVDMLTQLLVDYIPPAPSADHEWRADRRRWVLRPEVAERQEKHAAAMAQIEALDARSIRAMREFWLAQAKGEPVPVDIQQRLSSYENQIAELRNQLS